MHKTVTNISENKHNSYGIWDDTINKYTYLHTAHHSVGHTCKVSQSHVPPYWLPFEFWASILTLQARSSHSLSHSSNPALEHTFDLRERKSYNHLLQLHYFTAPLLIFFVVLPLLAEMKLRRINWYCLAPTKYFFADFNFVDFFPAFCAMSRIQYRYVVIDAICQYCFVVVNGVIYGFEIIWILYWIFWV